MSHQGDRTGAPTSDQAQGADCHPACHPPGQPLGDPLADRSNGASQDAGRRTVLKGVLAALAFPGIAGVERAAAQAALPHLDEKDPMAVALGYLADAKKVDTAKNPTYKPGQHCANCLQIQGKDGETWRGCNLFPGKLVHAEGWCRVWVAKPGAA